VHFRHIYSPHAFTWYGLCGRCIRSAVLTRSVLPPDVASFVPFQLLRCLVPSTSSIAFTALFAFCVVFPAALPLPLRWTGCVCYLVPPRLVGGYCGPYLWSVAGGLLLDGLLITRDCLRILPALLRFFPDACALSPHSGHRSHPTMRRFPLCGRFTLVIYTGCAVASL
jgi:hypothetical protein